MCVNWSQFHEQLKNALIDTYSAPITNTLHLRHSWCTGGVTGRPITRHAIKSSVDFASPAFIF